MVLFGAIYIKYNDSLIHFGCKLNVFTTSKNIRECKIIIDYFKIGLPVSNIFYFYSQF